MDGAGSKRAGRPWGAVPKASHTAGDIAALEDLEEKAEECAGELNEMSGRIEALENAAGLGGGKGDVADRVDDLEAAVADIESEKEDLQDRVYRLEAGMVRMAERLARLEHRW